MINANEGERREISRMDRLRSASKERKKVLKFGILFEIHILPAKKYRKICDDSMIGMNIREFLELDDKKKKLAKFSEFFIFLLEFGEKLWGKIRRMRKGKKIGKRIKQRRPNARVFFRSACLAVGNEGKKTGLNFIQGARLRRIQYQTYCARPHNGRRIRALSPSARRFLTNETEKR